MFCANLGAVLSSLSSPYWQTVTFGTSTNKALSGESVAVDSAGNVITVGVDYLGSASTGAFITKLSNTGDKVWQRKIASTQVGQTVSLVPNPDFVAVDSADNIVATVYDQIAFAVLVFKYDSAGNLLWQRRIPTLSFVNDWNNIAIDSADNISVVCLTSSNMTVLTISSAGTLTQQKDYGTLRLLRNIKYTSTGNRIVAGKGATYPALLSIDSTGAVVWGQTFSAGRSGRIECVAVDSTGNVYAVGGTLNVAGLLTQPMILKYSSAGVLQWQKIFTSTDAITFSACAVDSAGLVYAVGYSTASSPLYSVLMCIASDGAVVWQTKVQSTVSPSVVHTQLTGVSTRTPGVLGISGSVSGGASPETCQGVVSYISSSSATAGTWGWLTYGTLSLAVSNLGYTATALSQAVTTPAISVATSTLVNSVSAAAVAKYPITAYDYWQSITQTLSADGDLSHRAATVAADGTVYFVSTPSLASHPYITKVSASGQVVWQRRYTVTVPTSLGLRVVLNTAQDTLYLYIPRQGASTMEVVTYSTDGVLGLRCVVPSYGVTTQYSNNTICVDSSDNVYISAQISNALNDHVVTKLSSSLSLLYSKKLTTGYFNAPYGAVAAGSDGTYITTTEVASGNGVLFKMSTDGVTVLWQRYVAPAALTAYLTYVTYSASGFVYVGAVFPSGTEVSISKFNASTGATVWQRRTSGLANTVAGPCIAVDAADNSYVLTQIYNATPLYIAVLSKFDSAGTQVWQRKLTQPAGYQLYLTAMQLVGADALILTGYCSNAFRSVNAVGYVVKTDGSGVSTTLGTIYLGVQTMPATPYAVSTYTVASTTPSNTAVSTPVATSANSMTLTTGSGVSSTQAGTVAALFEIV